MIDENISGINIRIWSIVDFGNGLMFWTGVSVVYEDDLLSNFTFVKGEAIDSISRHFY